MSLIHTCQRCGQEFISGIYRAECVRCSTTKRGAAMKGLILVGLLMAGAAQAGTTTLTITNAFAELGYNCGGIHISSYVTGFDVDNHPTADVYLSTTCSGGGRGSHATTHSTWLAVTWDLSGNVLSETPISAPTVNPAAVFTLTEYGSTYTESSVLVGAYYQAQLATP